MDETAASGESGALVEGENLGGGRRRGKKEEAPELLDELAQETKRTALIDRVESQLKGRPHVARALVAFTIQEDKKALSEIEQKFKSWQQKQENQGDDLSGLLVFVQSAGIQLLEGPAELLFKALEFLYSLCGPENGKDAEDKLDAASSVSGASPLITCFRILHFTELHGVRTSKVFCSVTNPTKPQGGNQASMDENNCADFVYAAYNKIMVLCLKVREQCGESSTARELQQGYKRVPELMPTVDEVNTLLTKGGADNFFTYPEFEKVFVAPFNLVLHSELLWPMPPQLSY